MESFVLQLLHFPPCIRKLITGISSYHFKTFPQLMQWERSKTISSFLGILYIHTFKKLPMVIPKRNTIRNKIRLIITIYYLISRLAATDASAVGIETVTALLLVT